MALKNLFKDVHYIPGKTELEEVKQGKLPKKAKGTRVHWRSFTVDGPKEKRISKETRERLEKAGQYVGQYGRPKKTEETKQKIKDSLAARKESK